MNLKQIPIASIKSSKFKNIPNDIFSLLQDGVWLAGGATRSFITGEIPSDFDMFFKTQELADKSKQVLESKGYIKTFQCPIGSLTTYKLNDIKVQVITPRFYKSINELVDSFDFTTTLAGIDNKYLYINKLFIKDTKKKVLRIHRLTYPVATINRAYKYKGKGYSIIDCLRDILERVNLHDPDIVDLSTYYID